MGAPVVTSNRFVALRGTAHDSRTQDNISATLTPIATALNKTPIMGAPPPDWTLITLENGFEYTTTNQQQPAFQKDALGYVWAAGGGIQNAAGVAANTVVWTFPLGYRPGAVIHFAVKGNGATAQFIEVRPNGEASVEVAVGAGGYLDFYFSFLAEQ